MANRRHEIPFPMFQTDKNFKSLSFWQEGEHWKFSTLQEFKSKLEELPWRVDLHCMVHGTRCCTPRFTVCIYPRESFTCAQETCSRMFITALFEIVKKENWKYLNMPE